MWFFFCVYFFWLFLGGVDCCCFFVRVWFLRQLLRWGGVTQIQRSGQMDLSNVRACGGGVGRDVDCSVKTVRGLRESQKDLTSMCEPLATRVVLNCSLRLSYTLKGESIFFLCVARGHMGFSTKASDRTRTTDTNNCAFGQRLQNAQPPYSQSSKVKTCTAHAPFFSPSLLLASLKGDHTSWPLYGYAGVHHLALGVCTDAPMGKTSLFPALVP